MKTSISCSPTLIFTFLWHKKLFFRPEHVLVTDKNLTVFLHFTKRLSVALLLLVIQIYTRVGLKCVLSLHLRIY